MLRQEDIDRRSIIHIEEKRREKVEKQHQKQENGMVQDKFKKNHAPEINTRRVE